MVPAFVQRFVLFFKTLFFMLPDSHILPVEKRRRPAVIPLCEEVVIRICGEFSLACQASVAAGEPVSEARTQHEYDAGQCTGLSRELARDWQASVCTKCFHL